MKKIIVLFITLASPLANIPKTFAHDLSLYEIIDERIMLYDELSPDMREIPHCIIS